jgi:hypothetical protein
MLKIIALALVLPILLTPASAQADAPPLFHLAVADAPVENGKVLNMQFQEEARTPEASTVLVTRHSGGSVSSSMFVLRGMCGLARARGKQLFAAEPVPGDRSRFTVLFPDTAPAKGKVFTMAQCELMRY